MKFVRDQRTKADCGGEAQSWLGAPTFSNPSCKLQKDNTLSITTKDIHSYRLFLYS